MHTDPCRISSMSSWIFANQLESTPCDLTHEEAPMKRSGQTLLGQGGGSLCLAQPLRTLWVTAAPLHHLAASLGHLFGPALWQFSHKMWYHDDAKITSDVSWILSRKLANCLLECWPSLFLILYSRLISDFQCHFKLYNSYFHRLRYMGLPELRSHFHNFCAGFRSGPAQIEP